MFHVITPTQGDQIAETSIYFGGLHFGIFHGIKSRAVEKGLRPHSWSRDQFNNSNCVHLNMKGTLFVGTTGGNITTRDGPSGYLLPNTSSYGVICKTMNIGGRQFSDILVPGVDSQHTIKYWERWDWPTRWIQVEYTVLAHWITPLKVRLSSTRRLTSQSGAYVGSNVIGNFQEYKDSTFSSCRTSPNFYLTGDQKLPEDTVITGSYWTNTRVTLTGVTSTYNINPSYLYERLKPWVKECSSNDSSSFGQLSIDAVQALKVFDGQLSLLLRDILSIKATILSFYSGLRSLTLKGLSSAYLSYRYGLKLSYTDIKDLAFSARSVMDGKKGYNTSRSRLQRVITTKMFPGFKTDCAYTMKLYVRDYPDWIIEALQKMMTADFFPTLELVWDIIPFSFVVDWFIPIGDYLEAIDSRTLLSTYKVLGCVSSRRSSVHGAFGELFPDALGKVFGEFEIVHYFRYISPTPPPFLVDYTTPRSFNHYLEGAALIAQRSRV